MADRKNGLVLDKNQQSIDSSSAEKKSSGPHKVQKGPLVIAAIMIVIGSVTTVWGTYDYIKSVESLRWPKTTGTVLRSSVVQHHFGRENKTEVRYFPKIAYQYVVFGERYQADRIVFGAVSSGRLQNAQAVVDRFPAGSTISVYYHPNTPSTSVLRAGYQNNALAKIVAGLLFCLMGAFIYRSWRRKKVAL
jgi:hypothetical protein